jgi:hypothetical protein
MHFVIFEEAAGRRGDPVKSMVYTKIASLLKLLAMTKSSIFHHSHYSNKKLNFPLAIDTCMCKKRDAISENRTQ